MSKHVVGRRALRTAAVMALGLTAIAAACTPMPGTTLEEGGTYTVEVTIPSQHVTNEIPLPFGLGSCTAAVDTPEVQIPGTTVELPPFEYEAGATTASIPAVTVDLPRSRVSAGSFSLTCGEFELGRIAVSIEFDGVASVQSATLDTESHRITLANPKLEVTDAVATFGGAGASTPPVQLDPFTLEIPQFKIRI